MVVAGGKSSATKIKNMTNRQLADAEPFLRMIADRPGDALPRLIFADWLSEQGLWREELGERWAASKGKYPSKSGWHETNPRDNENNLPQVFYNNIDDMMAEPLYDVYSRPDAAQRYETEFLKRCGQLNWENGEPARPTEVTT